MGNLHVSLSDNLASFQVILGITLEQFGVTDENILTRDNLIKYVNHTSKPIGMIDITNNDIQFVKPSGSFDFVTIFVFLQNKIGLLTEDDEPMVKISSLPERIQEIYNNTEAEIKIRRRPMAIRNGPIVTRRRPMAAPLAPPLAAPLAPRRRPMAARNSLVATRRRPRASK